MVPGHHPVVKPHGQIGECELVGRGPRNSLERSSELVGEEAGNAPLERRKTRDRLGLTFAQHGAQPFKRIGSEPHPLQSHRFKGIGSQKRIPPGRLAEQRAVEKHQPRLIRECTHRVRHFRTGTQFLDEGSFHDGRSGMSSPRPVRRSDRRSASGRFLCETSGTVRKPQERAWSCVYCLPSASAVAALHSSYPR